MKRPVREVKQMAIAQLAGLSVMTVDGTLVRFTDPGAASAGVPARPKPTPPRQPVSVAR